MRLLNVQNAMELFKIQKTASAENLVTRVSADRVVGFSLVRFSSARFCIFSLSIQFSLQLFDFSQLECIPLM